MFIWIFVFNIFIDVSDYLQSYFTNVDVLTCPRDVDDRSYMCLN